MAVDHLMDIVEARKVVAGLGWSGFMQGFEMLYPEYGLYSCSQDWLNDSRFICKIKGVRGDLLIGWFGVHGEKPVQVAEAQAQATATAEDIGEALLTAFAFGAIAFYKGIICVPAYDREFMDGMCKGFKVGQNIPLLRAWAQGWSGAQVNI